MNVIKIEDAIEMIRLRLNRQGISNIVITTKEYNFITIEYQMFDKIYKQEHYLRDVISKIMHYGYNFIDEVYYKQELRTKKLKRILKDENTKEI